MKIFPRLICRRATTRMAFAVVDGPITGIAVVFDPDRLAATDLPDPGAAVEGRAGPGAG